MKDTVAYKDITLRQLQSFCETARLGSLTAAARQLGLAHPTVWKQVHALEEHFGVRLVHPHARGCGLTDEGKVLAALSSPLVRDIDRIREQFATERTRLANKLCVAASARILIEAVPAPMDELTRARPDVRVSLRQMEDARVFDAVESGEADVGLTASVLPPDTRPLLACSVAARLKVALIAPKGHPVTRVRKLHPSDLGRWPLVNSLDTFRNPAINLQLERYGAFRGQPRRVEAFAGDTVREYVRRGYGLGLIAIWSTYTGDADLWRRPMDRWFDGVSVYAVTKNTPTRQGLVQAFLDIFRRLHDSARPSRKPRG
ncbi:MAG TPA: LysR family transcriptional regulator [Planctomycetota bacterium]|nr:LysR family transcriptional regulator [Planctomycetota bacterium]